MTTPHLHVLALSAEDIWQPAEAGYGVGWCWLTVPRQCIFGTMTAEVTEWDYGIWQGSQPSQAITIARKAREIQGLDYKTGPAIVADDTAVRLCAMLELLHHENRMGDATLKFQSRDIIRKITDDSLKSLHMYVANPSISAAVKHALALLRRVKSDKVLAHESWPYPANGLA